MKCSKAKWPSWGYFAFAVWSAIAETEKGTTLSPWRTARRIPAQESPPWAARLPPAVRTRWAVQWLLWPAGWSAFPVLMDVVSVLAAGFGVLHVEVCRLVPLIVIDTMNEWGGGGLIPILISLVLGNRVKFFSCIHTTTALCTKAASPQ